MPRPCTICGHHDRAEIDRAVVSDQPFRRIAARFDISESALRRHVRAHLRPALAAATAIPMDAGTPLVGTTDVPLVAYFARRHIAELTNAASLRDHALRDLARVECLLTAAIDSGNGPAVLACLDSKWKLLVRAGMVEKLDAPLRRDDDLAPRDRQRFLRMAEIARRFVDIARHHRAAGSASNPGTTDPDASSPPAPANALAIYEEVPAAGFLNQLHEHGHDTADNGGPT